MSLARRHLLQLGLGIAAAAALDGCASAPPAQYFRLAPVAGTEQQTQPESIEVRDIGIPAYLNQDGIAEPSGQYQFISAANDLWAEPLAQMLQSVLVQNLTQRLPQTTITASSGMVGTPADLLVEVNILRFDPDATGRVTLIAQTALKQAADGRFLSTKTWQSSAMPAGADMPSMMAAMSALWARLADTVANDIALDEER
jgi:uncharacterized lipoprotein YmbA